jgi:ferredoxin
MQWEIIGYTVLIMGILGLVAAVIIAIASKLFRTEKVDDTEPVSAPEKTPRHTALVRCSGGVRARKKFNYVGLNDCVAALRVGGDGPNECVYGCLGLDTCVKVCRFGAMSIRDGVAVADRERCTGCLSCQKACPQDLIAGIPYTADVTVPCNSKERGTVLRRVCEIGCLGCTVCQRTCQNNSVTVQENVAVIDYDKCTNCGDCADKCPRKLIIDASFEAGNWKPSNDNDNNLE